jgi:hypothetical protein
VPVLCTAMGRRIDPEVAVAEMQAAGVEPLEPYPASNAPWRSRCHTCGNEVSPRLNDIRQGGGACWFCAGKAPTDPETARREFAEAGVEMIGDFTYTNVPTLCRCMTCGKEVSRG